MHLHNTDRVYPNSETNAVQGTIRWDAVKSIWLFAMIAGGVAAIVYKPSWGGALIFVGTSAITICAGHSVGMHRLLIHKSFQTPKWLEYILVWLGTLVGMAGPFGMIRAHDMRDWHQRQSICPPHPSHGAGFWRDAWWQMHCKFDLDYPPHFEIEPEIANDRVYQWMERHWMAQQLVMGVPLFLLGGIGFVLWGVCLRVAVSLTGHWMVGHFAHKKGHQGWSVEGLPVQGFNLRGLGLITFGENWHSNHHAFPHSARLGVEKGQLDPGYWFITSLEVFGLAHAILGPSDMPERDGLTRVAKEECVAFGPLDANSNYKAPALSRLS
ncbi:acyl-CoA desaturase [Loktanella sp. D2R18]|uniref:acyl-CoA desaturase n=1 Tax=Rhodobacterales TaxID=204455 RepID=UPI000DEBB8D3|nr:MULTISPECIES: fatty acid desaturase [Rhodobacterales]MDO6589973.1 fatty acid desaturase [Yoonia sp. 1_MG-2023]RBW45887.1 acyl-CoA desaturase [Loktanella sp. D2R18]